MVPTGPEQLGDITDYHMNSGPFGRTYRYWRYDQANSSSQPLFNFGFGMSYANITFSNLTLNTVGRQPATPSMSPLSATIASATILDEVKAEVMLSILRLAPSSTLRSVQTVVALYGTFLTANAQPSPVTALPIRQLLGFTKVTLAAAEKATMAVELRFKVSEIPGAHRQPFPGLLSVWVGDGGGPASSDSSTMLGLVLSH